MTLISVPTPTSETWTSGSTLKYEVSPPVVEPFHVNLDWWSVTDRPVFCTLMRALAAARAQLAPLVPSWGELIHPCWTPESPPQSWVAVARTDEVTLATSPTGMTAWNVDRQVLRVSVLDWVGADQLTWVGAHEPPAPEIPTVMSTLSTI